MGLFGKSATQKRIDELAYDNACLNEALEEAQRKNRELDGLANKYRIQRDAARIELAPLKEARERRLANLRNHKPRPNGAGAGEPAQGVPHVG